MPLLIVGQALKVTNIRCVYVDDSAERLPQARSYRRTLSSFASASLNDLINPFLSRLCNQVPSCWQRYIAGQHEHSIHSPQLGGGFSRAQLNSIPFDLQSQSVAPLQPKTFANPLGQNHTPCRIHLHIGAHTINSTIMAYQMSRLVVENSSWARPLQYRRHPMRIVVK